MDTSKRNSKLIKKNSTSEKKVLILRSQAKISNAKSQARISNVKSQAKKLKVSANPFKVAAGKRS